MSLARRTCRVVLSCASAAAIAPGARAAPKASYPKLSLTEGPVQLTVYLPDAKTGYYRGSRFDWSGAVGRVTYKGHTFFGPWHAKHDPTGQDAIEGTAEEFSMFKPLGFDEVRAGGVFYKIGVGGLVRVEAPVKDKKTGKMVEQEYGFWRGHKIAKPGPWRISHGKTWVQFVQDFTGQRGWGWHYTKRISLVKGSPAFTISRRLENTGSKTIDTTHYCHHFTIIDDEPIGPDYRVALPFAALIEELKGTPVRIEGREIVFPEALTEGKTVWVRLGGLRGSPLDNGATIRNRKTGASLTITGDREVVRYCFWSTRLATCPEPFVAVKLAGHTSMNWSNTYTFGATAVRKSK